MPPSIGNVTDKCWQLGFLVTPSPLNQRRRGGVKLQTTATGVATSTTRLSDMLRSSWTPIKLPTFGDPSMVSMDTPMAPVSGVGVGCEGRQAGCCSRCEAREEGGGGAPMFINSCSRMTIGGGGIEGCVYPPAFCNRVLSAVELCTSPPPQGADISRAVCGQARAQPSQPMQPDPP